MQVEIVRAREQDCDLIQAIQRDLRRPIRERCSANEYLIAWGEGTALGCAATAVYEEGGYFYGLAVRRQWQRQGIGGQLMEARLDALRILRAQYAVALAMFWNSRFFRAHGFAPVKRSDLPPSASYHADLKNAAYRRSAVMLRLLNQVQDRT
jgi:N-acetylglutamate synthase-like GNAT family acetyltransferase